MKLEAIFKSYGSRKIFEDFFLSVDEGEILCVLGESGGGKTTLLNILAGLTSYQGRILDKPEGTSYIFQEPRLLPNLTVWQNLKYAGGRDETIRDLLEKTELISCAGKRPGQLSGGEKQRVSFARAFLNPSGLLLMDEPFSSLDTALKIRLAQAFCRLWSQWGKGRTAVFVTHDVEEALMLADRIVVLKGGKIILDLRPERRGFPAPYGEERKERKKILAALLNG